MQYPKPIEDLIHTLSYLPGIGQKSAQRMTFTILDWQPDKIDELADALVAAKEKIHPCARCNSLTDGEYCTVCQSDRDETKLVVVEDTMKMLAFENMGNYRGKYYCLGGLVSPLRRIGPEKLAIEGLLKILDEGVVEEVILALSPTSDGEITTYFLKDMMRNYKVRVTKLAQGIAPGSSLEYYDAYTLSRAFLERRDVEDE